MDRTVPDHPNSGSSYTWEDFVALPDDDRRELLDGQLLEMDVPTVLHEWVVATLVEHLRRWAMGNRIGIVLASGYKVKIRRDRGFMPDVQLFRSAGRPIPDQALDAGAPDLAVEVISPASVRYDRVEKLRGYAAIGVPEYWIVDPERRTLERFVSGGAGDLVATDLLADDATFAPASLPGFTLELRELWSLPEWFRR